MTAMKRTSRFVPEHKTLILILSFVAFVSLGLPDAVLGVAWPSLRDTFGRPQSGLGVILFAVAAGYIASGLGAGRLIGRLGVGQLLVLSTAAVTIGLFGYAVSPLFLSILVFALIIGLGSGAIDAALNYFATEHFSEAVMSRLHAFFGLGALAGPIIMGTVLDRGVSWRIGYVVVASILLGMVVIFVVTRHLWDAGTDPDAVAETGPAAPVSQALRSPLVWGNILLFFLVTGIELTAGQWAYTVMRERLHQTEAVASLWAGLFWGALAFGRLTLGALSARIGPARVVQASTVGAAVGGILYATGAYSVAVAGLMLTGLSMSTLYPLLMTLTPRRVGRAISVHAVGFQVSAATLGGAALPWIAGFISGRSSLAAVGWVIVAAAIGLFVIHGSMMRHDDRIQSTQRAN